MLPNIGSGELLLLATVVLLLFGARRIPEAARSLGRSINAFKEGLRETSREAEQAEIAPEKGSGRTV